MNPIVRLLLLLFFMLVGLQAEAQKRIMTLGNSITQSNNSYKSYRYPLWKKLVDAQVSFDFVGSMRHQHLGNPVWPMHNGLSFDQEHEGHWGWRADEILNGRSGLGKLSDWLQGYTPDIVLLHLGTNDLYQGQGVTSTLADIRQVVGTIRARNPKVVVLLAKLIPVGSLTQGKAAIEAYNLQVPALAQELHRLESPVIVVDQFSGYSGTLDNYDGMHPNAQGEEKMAGKWFHALQPFLNSTSCPQAPWVTSKSHCGPGSITLSASGAPATGTYRWYTSSAGGTPLVGATAATFTTPVLSVSTTYYVSIVHNSCESARVPITATIYPVPKVVAAASAITLTAGSTTTLTASGAHAYTWSPVTGLSSSTGAAVTATPAYTTTYTVKGTSIQGCTSTASVTVTVNTAGRQTQTITFPSLPNKIYGAPSFGLTATASSGLQVNYRVVSGPAIVSGKTITLTGVGTVVVRAYHPGNDQYLAATPVDQSFSVLPATAKQNQTITFAPLPAKTYGDAPFSISTTASSGLPVSLGILAGPATIAGNIISLTGTGVVTVRATQAGNTYFNPASAESRFEVKSSAPDSPGCGLRLTSKITQAESWYGMWGTTGAGAIDVSVTGGTAPYVYRWSNGFTSQDVSPVAPGQYTVKVTDARGCIAQTTVHVGRKNDPLRLFASPANVSGAGGRSGSIDLSVAGGVGPFTYRWSNGAATEDLTGLEAGLYTVTVTDAFGRRGTASVPITAPTVTALTTAKKPISSEAEVAKEAGFQVYPNPIVNKATATFRMPAAGIYRLELFDGRGAKLKTLATGQAAADETLHMEVNINDYAQGIYLLKLVTGNGVYSERLVLKREY